MSAEQLAALTAAARDDETLAARLAAATSPDDVITIAADVGYTITTDDLADNSLGELTESELSTVAGGTQSSWCLTPMWNSYAPNCMLNTETPGWTCTP